MRWIDIMQDLVDAYNHSRHRSIGMELAYVQKKDENRIWVPRFGDGDTYYKHKIPRKAMVRARSHKTVFHKSYMPK